MLTRAGALLLATAAALAAPAWLLGLVELWVLAGAAVLVVGLALAWTWLRGEPAIEIRRVVHPTRVHVGRTARVEVTATGGARRATPVVTLVDPIDGRRGARLRLAPIGSGEVRRAAYRLPTRTRGELHIGPMSVEVDDPLGLARRTATVAERVRVVVLPHVEPIPPAPAPTGSQPLAGHAGRPAAGRAGDEFHSLRPYVVGDDIRRVHWPSTASAGDLVVRQDEEPRQGRVTVALDVEQSRAAAATFEAMVSAAASVAAAHWRRGDIVRLVTSANEDTGWVTGQAAFDGLLELLALVHRTGRSDLDRVLSTTDAGSDTLVVVGGDLPDEVVASIGRRRARRHGHRAGLTTVRFLDRPVPRTGPGRTARVIDVVPGASFPATWAAGVA